MWPIVFLVGCGSTPCDCGAIECAPICATTPAEAPIDEAATKANDTPSLTAFESSHTMPLLADIRAGVRPWSDDAISICPKGEPRTCSEALGATVADLPEGDFILHAELRVPNVGEKGTWKVHYSQECTTTKETASGTTSSSRTYENDYTVEYINDERGARLSPLARITSPNPHGQQQCTYSITAPHPDGDKVYKGEWSVPGAG